MGHVANTGRHLLQLINDGLDLSKVEPGKFEFFPEPVDLPRIAPEVTGVLHAEAARKGIRLVTGHDAGLNHLVLDPSRRKQMPYNFLSNAIEFTGSGITPTDQRKLFSQVEQIHSGCVKTHQGTGLGLALTKRLAELQGGSVGVNMLG